MNEIVNKLLLPGDKVTPEMYLRQSEFTYCSCRHLQKPKKEHENLKKHKIHNIFIKTN